MKTVDISIIIVNYNTRQLLRQLVDSLKTHCAEVNYEVIIVDNNSTDSSRELLGEIAAANEARVIFNEHNVGFGSANNIGFREARGDYVLLLNPDTYFVENSLDAVLAFRKQLDTPAIIGVLLILQDGSWQKTKLMFPRLLDSLSQAFFLNSIFKGSRWFDRIFYGWLDDAETAQVECIRGAFMFMDREVYASLNGFDEDFFLFSEEVDLCRRAGYSGVPIYYYPGTKVIHLEGQSMSLDRIKNWIELYRSQILLVRKHRGRVISFFFRWILCLSAFNRILLQALLFLLRRSDTHRVKAQMYAHSFLWFLGIKTRFNRQRLAREG